MIIEAGLPDFVAVDTSILISYLNDVKLAQCDIRRTALVEAIISTKRTLAIATAALGERLIGGDQRMWGIPNVEFLEFNVLGAREMARAIGGRAALRGANSHKQVVKFDAMIIGTYISAGVQLFVTDDERQAKMAKAAKLATKMVDELWQPDLFDLLQTATATESPAAVE